MNRILVDAFSACIEMERVIAAGAAAAAAIATKTKLHLAFWDQFTNYLRKMVFARQFAYENNNDIHRSFRFVCKIVSIRLFRQTMRSLTGCAFVCMCFVQSTVATVYFPQSRSTQTAKQTGATRRLHYIRFGSNCKKNKVSLSHSICDSKICGDVFSHLNKSPSENLPETYPVRSGLSAVEIPLSFYLSPLILKLWRKFGFWNSNLETWKSGSKFEQRSSKFEFQILKFEFRISNFKFRISKFEPRNPKEIWTSAFEIRPSQFEIQNPAITQSQCWKINVSIEIPAKVTFVDSNTFRGSAINISIQFVKLYITTQLHNSETYLDVVNDFYYWKVFQTSRLDWEPQCTALLGTGDCSVAQLAKRMCDDYLLDYLRKLDHEHELSISRFPSPIIPLPIKKIYSILVFILTRTRKKPNTNGMDKTQKSAIPCDTFCFAGTGQWGY